MRKILLVIIVAAAALSSCKYFKPRKAAARDTTINKQTSFNPVFLDSIHVDAFMAKHPEFRMFIEQFRDFYSHRNYEYAWFDTAGLAEQAHNFINLQNSYINEFSDSSLYNKQLLLQYEKINARKTKPSLNDPDILETELLLTGQFFQYAAKVYKGSDIDVRQLGWYIPRKKIDLSALLDSTLKSKVTETDQYAPLNPQYKKLQEQLTNYLSLEKREGKDTIAWVAKPLKKGDSTARIVQIKKRLQLLGDMEPGDTSMRFDSTLFTAAKKFQHRMGLLVDGVIGNKMLAELNVPITQRVRQLLVNMERVRWMPAEKDTNYVLVNIPEYKLHVYDSGYQVFDMNVIVGTAANNTVIFNGTLKYIVFSPYWNVPESIVRKEIVPAMRSNRHYIEKNNMEITGYSNGLPVIRQKPGPKNSLGLVKFLFPNNYSIYLHDTPNRELFSLSSRSFSHGCIRISEPKKFAEYLLRDEKKWTTDKIDSAMHLSKEKWVTLKKGIPVFVVYFTAWVDKEGLLNFRKDIYGHDAKMSEKLFIK